MEGAVLKTLYKELTEPSDEIVRLVANNVSEGRLTAATRAAIRHHIPNAFNALVRERLNERLSSAIDEGTDGEPVVLSEFETTADEIEGFQIVRAIASEIIDPMRVHMRDSKSYCAILLDDNNRKPIARLWFNSETARYVSTFDEGKDETRNPIKHVSEIYKHKQKILARVKMMIDELEAE